MSWSIVFWIIGVWVVTASAAATGTDTYSPDYTWIKAVAICVAHILATQIRPLLRDRAQMVNSFAAGMSVTYIFLHLAPEIDDGHDLLGKFIYLFLLAGFTFYYGLEKYLLRSQAAEDGGDGRLRVILSLGSYWVYNWLIVVGLPDGPSISVFQVSLITIAIGLHLLYNDYDFGSEHPEMFDRWGRFVVASAPLVGLLCRVYLRPDIKVFKDIFTATLAGSVVYSVFKKELPHPERSSLKSFFVGILCYTVLLVLIDHV